jgi:DNA primase large subunit
VNHIKQGGGDGEAYTPPTYATLESWGIEWEKDNLEQSVKHPLQYYQIKLQELEEEEENEEESEEESEENTDDDEETDAQTDGGT